MRSLFALGMLLGLLGILLPPAALGAEPPPLLATLDGPPALAPGARSAYNLTILGGPIGVPTNYTIVYYLLGTDTTDASPTATSPGKVTGNQTRLSLNVTAPKTEQTLTLHAEVTAQAPSYGTQSTVTEISLLVVTPLTLEATFRNGAPTAATNVTVRFYVDGLLVGTSRIASIPAGGEGTAKAQYLPVGLATGPHTVRVEADLNGDGIIDPSMGEVVTSEIFYRSAPPLSTGWTILIGLAVFVPALLATVALRRRGQT